MMMMMMMFEDFRHHHQHQVLALSMVALHESSKSSKLQVEHLLSSPGVSLPPFADADFVFEREGT